VAAIEGKTAFVFSGGGSLGAIQVGMLRVLLSYGLKPDFVVGASVGAINASYFASAPDAECVARLEQIWSGLRRADIFPFTLTSAFGLIRRRGHIVDPGKLRRVVETNLPCSRIEDAKIPLHIMATTQEGIGMRLSSGSAVDAILASTAIPGVFPAVDINGRSIDGRSCCGQHAGAPGGRPWRLADHHTAHGLRLRLERTAEGSDRSSSACDHVDDCLAAHL
jgi:NTE family protein